MAETGTRKRVRGGTDGKADRKKALEVYADAYGLDAKGDGSLDLKQFSNMGPGGGWDLDTKSGALTMAATLPDDNRSLDLLKDIEDLSLTSDDTRTDIIGMCWKLYEKEPMVGAGIDTMIALAATRPIVHCDDEKLRAIIKDAWFKKLNYHDLPKEAARTIPGMREFLREVLLHWWVTGDAIWVENWKRQKILESETAAVFPVGAKVHDISTLEIQEQFKGTGYEVIALKISSLPEEMRQAIKDPQSPPDRALRRMVSPIIRKAIQNDEDTAILPGEITWHMARHQRRANLHGTGLVRRAFSSASMKALVQAVDTSVLRGLVAQLTILQMGHDEPESPYHVPTPTRMAALKRILDNLKNISLVAWAGKDIHPLTVVPDSSIFNFDKRYEPVEDMLSLSLAMSRLFIDGKGSGSQQHDWAAYLSMLAKLDYPRSQFEVYLNMTAEKIAEENKFKGPVSCRLQRVNLTDRTFKNIFLNAFEKGLVGRRDSLEELGLDADAVIENQLKEKEEKLNELIGPPALPYTPQTKPAPDEGRPEGPADAARAESRPPEDPMLQGWLDHLGSIVVSVRGAFQETLKTTGRVDAGMAISERLLGDFFQRLSRMYLEFRLRKQVDAKNPWLLRVQEWMAERLGEESRGLAGKAEVLGSQRETLGAEVLDGAIGSAFQEFGRALEGLLRSTARRSVWAGELEVQAAEYVAANVRIPEGAVVCERCAGLVGRRLDLKELWEVLPCEEGCKPELRWLTETGDES